MFLSIHLLHTLTINVLAGMDLDLHVAIETKNPYPGATQIPESLCYIQLRISPTIRRVSLDDLDTI